MMNDVPSRIDSNPVRAAARESREGRPGPRGRNAREAKVHMWVAANGLIHLEGAPPTASADPFPHLQTHVHSQGRKMKDHSFLNGEPN